MFIQMSRSENIPNTRVEDDSAGDSEGQKKDLQTDTDEWLTRKDCSQRLHITVKAVRDYERRGVLIARRALRSDKKGSTHKVVVLEPRSVERLREKLEIKAAKFKRVAPKDTSGWMTREQGASFRGVSIQTLKNYEDRGVLHPVRARREDDRGHMQNIVLYHPTELLNVPRGRGTAIQIASRGDIAARVYELFDRGHTIHDAVIELRQTPEEIHGLYDRWLLDKGSKLMLVPEAKADLEKKLGPFESITEMIEKVMALPDKAPAAPESTKDEVTKDEVTTAEGTKAEIAK